MTSERDQGAPATNGPERSGSRAGTSAADGARDQLHTILDDVRPALRPPLDRGEREIKDAVLRMGVLVEDQILAALDALSATMPRPRSRSFRTIARSTRPSSTCPR